RSDFITYEQIESSAQSSERNTSFQIVGKGTVQKRLWQGDKLITLSFANALHAPDITSDLISIGRRDLLGYHVVFGNGQAK
ncbi:hypothetical protein F5890DRAFT_1392506, partial [Lentinula detonsa]